jgi:hypothetical protein
MSAVCTDLPYRENNMATLKRKSKKAKQYQVCKHKQLMISNKALVKTG